MKHSYSNCLCSVMDAHISPKDEVRVRLSTEVLKYKIMEELKLIRDNYWATKDGRIYSTKRNRYLKQRVGPRGYMMVNLSIDGKCKTFTVHRLIASTFIPNPNGFDTVNHKDGNKTNNNVNNLEWTTSSGNTIHAFETGLRVPTYKHGQFSKEDINEIRRLYNVEHLSQYKIAGRYNVSRGNIQQILNGSIYKD